MIIEKLVLSISADPPSVENHQEHLERIQEKINEIVDIVNDLVKEHPRLEYDLKMDRARKAQQEEYIKMKEYYNED